MRRLLIPGALALALSLSACDGGSAERPPEASASASAAGLQPTPSSAPPASAIAAPAPSASGLEPSASASGPIAASPSQLSQTPSPSASKPNVDVASSPPSEDDSVPFDQEYPSLGGITLGMDESDVRDALGSPLQQYELSEAEGGVRMNEYEELTVGYDDSGKVVYAEVSASGAATGITGLSIGTDGSDAAEAIGADYSPDAQVLVRQVAGGMLKIDLDPQSHRAISVKLIGQR